MEALSIDYSKYSKALSGTYAKMRGKVINVVGLTIESAGPLARMGDICRIYPKDKEGEGAMSGEPALSEVVGFKNGRVLLMPYENTYGIGEGSIVENTDESLQVYVSDDLLGKTLDGFGRLDSTSDHPGEPIPGGIPRSVESLPPDAMIPFRRY